MNWDMVGGVLRHILTTGGALLASKGIIEASQVEPVAGALIVLAGFLWSLWAKRKAA